MGYITKDIADITEPAEVSLAGRPNFVEFASKAATKTYLELDIGIHPNNGAELIVTEPSGTIYTLKGTTDIEQVAAMVFYISDDNSETAENLRQALLNIDYVGANFDISLPISWANGVAINSNVVHIKSKGAGKDYNMQIAGSGADFTLIWINEISENNDSISGEDSTVRIDLDVYDNVPVFLGAYDAPNTPERLGTYSVTLSKTYSSGSVWFDLNKLFYNYMPYNAPRETAGWFDTGTCKVFRFAARVTAANSYTFYLSNALFVISGFARLGETIDMREYVYAKQTFKLLTNKPETVYYRGQREFLNFILSDPARDVDNSENYTLSVRYRAFSNSGAYLGAITGQTIQRTALSIVNTCRLNIDAVLDAYPKAARVLVALQRDGSILSNDLAYEILPECTDKLLYFSFLNRLGGWDTFNFNASRVEEIDPEYETYNRTITPDYDKAKGPESVHRASLAQTWRIDGAPVTDEVANWLKEMAASRIVLDDQGRAIIIEDFKLPVSDANRNMQVPQIRYRLSETYTNE